MQNCRVQGDLLGTGCCVVLVYLLTLHWWQFCFWWREFRKKTHHLWLYNIKFNHRSFWGIFSTTSTSFIDICVFVYMGMSENGVYPQWNSHLVGIMISKTIGFLGVHYFQTNPYNLIKSGIYSPSPPTDSGSSERRLGASAAGSSGRPLCKQDTCEVPTKIHKGGGKWVGTFQLWRITARFLERRWKMMTNPRPGMKLVSISPLFFSINNQGWTGDGDVCDQIHVLQSFSEDAQWFIFRCWETFWLDASLNSAALSENAESTAQNAEHLQTLPF